MPPCCRKSWGVKGTRIPWWWGAPAKGGAIMTGGAADRLEKSGALGFSVLCMVWGACCCCCCGGGGATSGGMLYGPEGANTIRDAGDAGMCDATEGGTAPLPPLP